MSNIKALITRHEGDKLKPYKCPAGKNTIGRGWNFDANPLPTDIARYLQKHGEITQEMSDRLLDISISMAQRYCFKLFPGFLTFTPDRQNALTDWMFNVGIGTALQFKNTIKAVNEKRWDDAAEGLKHSLWYKQVGNRGPEIVGMVKEG